MLIVLECWCDFCTGALEFLLYWSTAVFIVVERWCVYCTGARSGVLILLECW